MAEGYGVALLISRYSSGANMSGFFWTLGGGMREERFNWQVAAEENDPQADLSLVDDKNRFDHEAIAKGATGHLRIGYRYVAESFPIAAGVYFGARHFQPSIEDGESKDEQKNAQPDPMTDLEKERLKRRVATAPEAGIEFGFSF